MLLSSRNTMTLDKKQRKILNIAIKLFYEHGYTETTVRDIAKKMKTQAPALYHIFQSKDDILIWICDDIIEHFDQIMKFCKESTLDDEGKFRFFIKSHVENVLNNVQEYEIAWHYWEIADKKMNGKYKAALEVYFEFIKELSYSVISKNQFGPHFHQDTAIFAIIQIINHVPKWARKVDGKYEIDCIAKEIADRFLYGYNK